MGTAATTIEKYIPGDRSEYKLRGLLTQFNTLVINVRTLMANLDAEVHADVDSNYAAQLTAKEVNYLGYTADGTATTGAPDPEYLGEDLCLSLIEQFNAAVANIRTIVTKLNGDNGIAAADYASTVDKIPALGVAFASGEVNDLLGGEGAGIDGRILEHLSDQFALLLQQWHNIAAKLDAETGSAAAAVADGGNTGNGTVDDIVATHDTVTETITIVFTSATEFDVDGSVTGALASGEIGEPYTSAVVGFEITAGGVAFVAGDEFTIAMTVGKVVDDYETEIDAKVLTSGAL